MMRVAIDCRMYSESGIGRYIRNLISNLQILDKTNDFFLLLTKDEFNTLNFQTSNFHKVLADFRWYGVEEQIKLLGLLRSLKPDLVHFPHFNVPILYQGKFVVTIHDLIHQHYQMKRSTTLDPLTYRVKQFGYRKVFRNAIIKSEKILVPSKYVKDTLTSEWKVKDDKIIVTYEAVDDNLSLIADKIKKEKVLEVLKRFDVKPPYIFYVGNAHPHKNIEGLIKVFGEIRAKYQSLQLVLAGHDHYFWERLKREFQHKDIIYTGWISDEEMVALYKNAEMSVMPSFEEGFGIPLLEAMAGGCPVVSSNKGALMEVGGDACLYFDPFDKGDMGDKIERILNSEELRQDLIKKGKKRVRPFSWESLAKQTLEVYQQCG